MLVGDVKKRCLQSCNRYDTLFCILFIIFSGCSVQNLANEQIINHIQESEQEIRKSSNFYLVERALPSFILMIDSTITKNPSNIDLLIQGAKIHFIYAKLFIEKENEEWAQLHYKQAKVYIESYFNIKHHFPPKWENLEKQEFLTRLDSISETDIEATFWLAMNWGSWISLNRDNIAIFSYVSYVEELIKRVISWNASYEDGLPYLFLANLHSVDQVASQYFEKAFDVSKRKLFAIHIDYAKTLAKFSQNQSLFEELLTEVITGWENPSNDSQKKFNLINSVSYNEAKNLINNIEDFYEEEDE